MANRLSSIPNPKVILITGCSSGFGLLIATRLAAHRHTVIATMRNLDKRQALLDEVQKRNAIEFCKSNVIPAEAGIHKTSVWMPASAGMTRSNILSTEVNNLQIFPLDVTDIRSIKATVAAVEVQHGRIDVLVNNAGYGIGGFFEDLTQAEIRGQLDTNFFGVQNVTREVIPIMRRQRQGKIINISSIAGLYALPGFGAYNASKWALEGFSESLYYEMRLFGVNVCLVEPGTYRTTIFYGNKRYAKNFNNPQSPYYKHSKYFSEKVDKYVAADKKDPEDIAILVEKLVNAKNPSFRNIPDRRSKILFVLKRFLPFKVFSGLLYKALFSRMAR